MADEKKVQNSKEESGGTPKAPKDRWDKADVLFKFVAALVIGLLGFWGNQFLQEKQKVDSDIKLYTQLLSNKEASENSLRKDMFGEILKSFLKPKDEKNSTRQETLARIQEMRLSLELLSRNFHECLDMKPLFKHLLAEIIHPRLSLRRCQKQIMNCRESIRSEGAFRLISTGNDSDGKLPAELIKNVADASAEAAWATNNETLKIEPWSLQGTEWQQEIEDQNNKVVRLLDHYNKEMEKLIQTAKRVTAKQREILEEVAGTMILEIPLNGEQSANICTAYRPGDWLPTKEGTCKACNDDVEGIIRKPSAASDGERVGAGEVRKVEGVKKEGMLAFRNSDGSKDERSSRYFRVRVRYAYPKWKQIYVEVSTCPGKKFCEENDSETETAEFWLEYFDFPLVDNTYLDSKQRYSVILEDIETDRHSKDVKAKINLLYYPAAYAGLKEKAFYNNQLLRTLLKSQLFGEKADVEERT